MTWNGGSTCIQV